MPRQRVTKTEKLLREMARRPKMRHGQMVRFLRKLSGKRYDPVLHRDTYNAMLYGTKERQGFLDIHCIQNRDRSYSLYQYATDY